MITENLQRHCSTNVVSHMLTEMQIACQSCKITPQILSHNLFFLYNQGQKLLNSASSSASSLLFIKQVDICNVNYSELQ